MAKKKAVKKAVKSAVKKPAVPNWRDSTYNRQMSYFKKLSSDYSADETRQRGEVNQYYGSESAPGKKTAVTKKVSYKLKKGATKKEAARQKAIQARIGKLKAKRKVQASKHHTKRVNAITRRIKGKKKNLAGLNKAINTPGRLTAGEKKTYAQYKKYATPQKAASWLKSHTTGTKSVNVYDKVKQKHTKAITKTLFDKRKMTAGERKKYKKLVARGNPKHAGPNAVKFKQRHTRGKKTVINTGRTKTWYTTAKKQRFYQKGKHAATEGIYQKNLRQQRTKDLDSIKNDYAARGVLHSGLYAKKNSDYEQEFGKQLAETNRKKQAAYQDISTKRNTFNREQDLQKEQSRLDAIRRRAAQVGSFIS